MKSNEKERRFRLLTEERAIVLDKSFLRSANSKQVRSLCDTHNVIMPEELFFEILHSDEETKTIAFAKFPRRDSPVGLLPLSVLLKYEREHRRPSSPIWRHAVTNFKFSERLAAGTFEMRPEHLEGVLHWESDLSLDAEHFAERAKLIVKIFPSLEGFRPGQDRTRLDVTLRTIASNMEGIRGFYEGVVPKDFPPASIVGRSWALFRYFQVHLTADVEFFAKYGVNVNTPSTAKLENERADLNYLILAVLAGGLASNDKALKERFQALRPDGILVEVDQSAKPVEAAPSFLPDQLPTHE
jgi:hypothetical protein